MAKKNRKTPKADAKAEPGLPEHLYPRVGMVTAWRLVAERDGLPARCPDRRCRRAGRCHAVEIDERETPCARVAGETTLWRQEAAMWGVLAHWWHVMEDVGESGRLLAWADVDAAERVPKS